MQSSIDIQGFRLSPQQKRLWTIQQAFGTACAQGTLVIQGALDVVRLERAVDAAMARHEALRTLFCREPGVKVPLQVIVEQSKPAWETVELQAKDAAAQATKRDKLLEDHRRQTIDWGKGPLVRCTLCRLSSREHWLLISLPAMCADARTLHNLAREIAAGYGTVGWHEQDEAPVQYARFAEWQNELVAEEDAPKGRQFWREVLADLVPITVPFEQTGEEAAGWPIEAHILDLDTEVVASLLALSKRREIPVEALVLSAWQTVLSRVGGRRAYLMALLSDGRKYEELESGMGLFAKWVPLRCRVDPDKSFQELAAAIATDQHHVREWQEYFMWDSTVEATGPAVTEMVGFEFETVEPLAYTTDVAFSFEPTGVRFEPLKLILSCMRRNRSIQLRLQADPRRIPVAALPILSETLSALLTGAAAQPETRIGLLPLLSESQRCRLSQAGHGAAYPLSASQSLVTLFEHQAAARPETIAVVCGDCRLTYAELNARANQIAHGLNRMGVGRGALVGLCVERSIEMVAGLLGVLKAGAAYVPLDPDNSPVRLAFEISQGGIAAILTQEKWQSRLPTTGTPMRCLDFHDWTFAAESVDNPDRLVYPLELAYVIYTSGSTGVPKGVAVTHLGVLNYTDFICRALGAEAGLSYATVSTLGADLGNTVIFASLASGGCLHVIGYDTVTDGRKFGAYCAKYPMDVLKIVPAHFQSLLATAEGAEVLPRRLLVLGGDVLSHALADQVSALGCCRVLNHYGPTEATIGCLTFPVEPHHEDARLSATVPIGRPIDNAEAYVLDERLDPVPVGVTGELYLGGAGLARGYLGRPDLTAQRFVPHPLASEPGSRLYKTGDVARVLSDGTVEFLGRTDFQIKLRGYRIEFGEIEARLTEHPDIQQAVVTARASQADEKYLAAYIVSRDVRGEPSGWREFLKERLPDYMIPTALVCLPALPLNQNGKVDRALLPDPEKYLASSRRYVAPRNPAEEMLTGIWATILKRDQIGIHDNFFDLGGHSLLATQVMARVRSVFRVELPLRALFEATTVERLAVSIANGGRENESGMVCLRSGESLAPLYCFDPSGTHVQVYRSLAASLKDDRPVWGLSLSHIFSGTWQDLSIESIAERHVRLMRERQSEGPYYLVGWSNGGVLAFAAARHLEQLGEQVAFLGVLDTQPDMTIYKSKDPTPVDEVLAYIRRECQEAFDTIPEQARDEFRKRLDELSEDEMLDYAIRWAQERDFLSIEEATVSIGSLKLSYALNRAMAFFMKSVQVCPIHSPVYAWWATNTIARHGSAPLDWSQYTTGTVSVDMVVGDHMNVVQSIEVHQQIDEILSRLEKIP
jgi:amino acid adenylation domain-containing protein